LRGPEVRGRDRNGNLTITRQGSLRPEQGTFNLGDMAASASDELQRGVVPGLLGIPEAIGTWAEQTAARNRANAEANPNDWTRATAPDLFGGIRRGMASTPSSQDFDTFLNTTNAPDGGTFLPERYRSETHAGEISRKSVRYAPGALFGPAGLASSATGLAADVGVSEAARALGADRNTEDTAGMIAGVGGSFAPGARVTRAPNARPAPPVRSRAPRTPPELAVDTPSGGFQIVPPPGRGPSIDRLRRADRRVIEHLDTTLAEQGVTREQLLADVAAGKPVWAAGEGALSGPAEAISSVPGTGGRLVAQSAEAEALARPSRVAQSIERDLGGRNDYFATLRAQTKARSEAARAEMAFIGEQQVTLDPNSVAALRSPLAVPAIRNAADNALSSIDPAVRESGARLNRLAQDLLDNPGSQTIRVRDAQDISGALLDAADAGFSTGGTRGQAAALRDLGRAIRDNARTPERGGFSDYGKWLDTYGTDSENLRALQMGRDMFSGGQGVNAESLALDLADMGPAAMDHYRRGVGEAVLAQVRSKGDLAAVRGLLRGAENNDLAARGRLAFGDRFDQWLSGAEEGVDVANTSDRITKNSRSAFRLSAVEAGEPRVDLGGYVGDVASFSPRGVVSRAGRDAARLGVPSRNIYKNPGLNEALGRALTDPAELRRLWTAAASDSSVAGDVLQAARQLPQVAAQLRRAIPAFRADMSPAQFQVALRSSAFAATASAATRAGQERPGPPRRPPAR